MSGFKALAFAAQKLDDALKNAYVGMVPCSEVGQFDSSTEKWEKEISDLIREIEILNSKSLMVKASLQKDTLPDCDLGDTSIAENMCTTVTNAVRWRKVLRAIAMSRAAKEILDDRENRKEEILILNELTAKLFKQQQKLDLLEELEIKKRLELLEARDEWGRCSEEYGIKSKVNYMSSQNEEVVPEGLEGLIRKIDIMQMISTKLLTSSHKYDWVQDPKGFMDILIKLRKNKLTSDTFV